MRKNSKFSAAIPSKMMMGFGSRGIELWASPCGATRFAKALSVSIRCDFRDEKRILETLAIVIWVRGIRPLELKCRRPKVLKGLLQKGLSCGARRREKGTGLWGM